MSLLDITHIVVKGEIDPTKLTEKEINDLIGLVSEIPADVVDIPMIESIRKMLKDINKTY